MQQSSFFFFSSRRRHTRLQGDWSSDVCSSDLTHLPLYSLRAAATRFGEDMQVDEEDWVRIPPGIRPSDNLFVVHVVGRSMEPRIPDGSLNIFRAPVVGSRQNKIVLVELLGQLHDSARYTVKKYTSRKIQTGEDEWQHESIRLEPLN